MYLIQLAIWYRGMENLKGIIYQQGRIIILLISEMAMALCRGGWQYLSKMHKSYYKLFGELSKNVQLIYAKAKEKSYIRLLKFRPRE